MIPVLDFKFFLTIQNESDRGTALVCAEALYNQLAELISTQYVHKKLAGWSQAGNLTINNGFYSKLAFQYRGVLGNGSERIKMAWLLGLISEEIYLSLEVVRKVRNDFAAHSTLPMSFENENILSKIQQAPIGIIQRTDFDKAKNEKHLPELIIFNVDDNAALQMAFFQEIQLGRRSWISIVHACSTHLWQKTVDILEER